MDYGLKLNINQTGSFLVANNQLNYLVYHLKPFEKFMESQTFENVSDFEIKYVKMYYSTNILLIVVNLKKNNAPAFLIYDTKEKKIINLEEIEEAKQILSIELNRANIYVLCQDCIYIYGFPVNIRLEKLNKIKFSVEKPNGKMAISESPDLNIIAYSNFKNDIFIHHIGIFVVIKAKNKIIIIEKAHNQNITCLKFNNNSTILASGSENGKKVRLWNTNDGKTIKELKTSFKKFSIDDVAFSKDSTNFCCVSIKGHIDFFYLNKIIDSKSIELIQK